LVKKKDAVFFVVSLAVLTMLLTASYTPLLISPPLLPLLDPVTGFWSERAYSKIPDGLVVKDSSLSNKVIVVFDKYGVPHIYASSLSDAFFALGYIHARERLWQMDIFRRSAEGLLSEILGEDALPIDIFIRSILIPYYANVTLHYLMENSTLRKYYDLLVSYSKGVNKFISGLTKSNMPLMFKLLGYEPKLWKPLDTVAFAVLMSWDLTGVFDDLYFYEVAQKLGFDNFTEIFPIFRPYTENYTIVQNLTSESIELDWEKKLKESYNPNLLRVIEKTLNGLFDVKKALSKFSIVSSIIRVGLEERYAGSNNWAVSGEKTKSGKPILCSDPHLAIDLPVYWYLVHVVVPGVTNMYGVTFPGSPAVVIGFNDYIAWGLTNTQADVIDFYYYKINGDKYYYKGEWKDFGERVETIPVKDSKPYELKIRSTVHGPILTGEITGFNYTVAMKWTGHDVVTNLITLLKLYEAKGYTDFVDALKYWNVPAQNFAYADSSGNIAIWSAGNYPVRDWGEGLFPYNGSNGEGEWKEFVPFWEIPHQLNPSSGFVASANQRPYPKGYKYFLGIEWDPYYRARRIYDVLRGSDNVTVEDMQKLQLDYFNVLASRLLPPLLSDLDKADLNDLEKEALNILKSWDYEMDKNYVAPTIWYYWFTNYREMIWRDEWESRGITTEYNWGHNGLNKYQPPLEYTEYITREVPNATWFDNVTTKDIIENRTTIAIMSFKKAIKEITSKFGENPDEWKWGKINMLYVEHISGLEELSRGPFPLSGGLGTVNSWGTGIFGGGAGLRMIVDFANKSNSKIIIAGGQSGHILSSHYDDLLLIYVKGGYITPLTKEDPSKIPSEYIEAKWQFMP